MYIYIHILIAWSIAWSSSSGTSECHHPGGITSQPVRLDHYYGAWILSCMVELLPLPPCDHPQGPKSGNCTLAHPCNKTRKTTLLAPGGLELRWETKGLKASLSAPRSSHTKRGHTLRKHNKQSDEQVQVCMHLHAMVPASQQHTPLALSTDGGIQTVVPDALKVPRFKPEQASIKTGKQGLSV